MSRLFTDTSPEVEEVLIELLRQVPPWRKLEMVTQLNETVRLLAMSGLRSRYPDASPEELYRRLADLLIGLELSKKVPGYSIRNRTIMLPEPITVTMLVVEALEKSGIPYWIGGSLASAVHGVARSTLDSDIIADLRLEHAQPLAQALEKDFYVDLEMIRSSILQRSSFNVIHLETLHKVDIFALKSRPFDQIQLQRRQRQVLSTDPAVQAYVCTPEDIVLAKLEWYSSGGEVSSQQWQDILGVLKAQANRLDTDYLHTWAAELEVADLLSRALREAGL